MTTTRCVCEYFGLVSRWHAKRAATSPTWRSASVDRCFELFVRSDKCSATSLGAGKLWKQEQKKVSYRENKFSGILASRESMSGRVTSITSSMNKRSGQSAVWSEWSASVEISAESKFSGRIDWNPKTRLDDDFAFCRRFFVDYLVHATSHSSPDIGQNHRTTSTLIEFLSENKTDSEWRTAIAVSVRAKNRANVN